MIQIDLNESKTVEFSRCYARYDNDNLIIGNANIERIWKIKNGLLYTKSFYNKHSKKEWAARESTLCAPYPKNNFGEDDRKVLCTASYGKASVLEEPSLNIKLIADGADASIVYNMKIFDNAGGVTINMQVIYHVSKNAESCTTENKGQSENIPSGIEIADLNKSKKALDIYDSLELIDLMPKNLKLIQVELKDQTDIHNELVFEKEWLLHSNEENIILKGNIFVIEDVISKSGLIFLKQAPLPHARPNKCEYDMIVNCRSASFSGKRMDGIYDSNHAQNPLPYRCGFYGHGIEKSEAGYSYAVIAYDRGEEGRTEEIHKYQRQFRIYDPNRDAMFLSNTWGDRSRDGRINESFLSKEIEAGSRFGVDVTQIDDGWQKGTTANSVNKGGVWQGFWNAENNFWSPHQERLPNGLEPLLSQINQKNMKLGLWFAPDSANSFENWEKDAEIILDFHRNKSINYIKIDGVKAITKEGEINLHKFFSKVLEESQGKVVFDLDVTAEIRPGYLGILHSGPIFVENRYSDFHRYWPHQTLRNLWKLSKYIDPLRLRMEFLNNVRNADLYIDDPLAPSNYSPAYLFATVMFSNPLGWFEVSNLPQKFIDEVAPLVAIWKKCRREIFEGNILPIGETPDGTAWTGFVSYDNSRTKGYVLIFREYNEKNSWTTGISAFEKGAYSCNILSGTGEMTINEGIMSVNIAKPQDYLFACIDRTE